jgi:hypothetical protein
MLWNVGGCYSGFDLWHCSVQTYFRNSFVSCNFLITYIYIFCLFLARGGLYIPTKQWSGQSMVNDIGFNAGVGCGALLSIACLYEV